MTFSSAIKDSAGARLSLRRFLAACALVCFVVAAGSSAAAQPSRRWYIERTYANSQAGDFIGGEDLTVRHSAI